MLQSAGGREKAAVLERDPIFGIRILILSHRPRRSTIIV